MMLHLVHIGISLLLVVGFSLFLVAAELAFPKGNQASPQARTKAAIFIAISVIFGEIAASLSARVPLPGPLFSISAIACAILALLAFDLLLYALHRAQHRLAWLWRFHAVHHSAEELGVPGGYHHVSEPFLRALACSIPVALLFGNVWLWGYISAATTLHGFYVHSTTRLNFGRFSVLVADNRYHRIHHSLDRYNSNFAVVFPLWDWLFGTAYFPKADEWPRVGLADRSEPQTVLSYLLASVNADRSPGDVSAAAVVNANGVNV